MMTSRWMHVSAAFLFLVIAGCSAGPSLSPVSPAPSISPPSDPVVPRIHHHLREWFQSAFSENQAKIIQAHEAIDTFPGRYKHRLAVQPLRDPWHGLAHLESRALLVAKAVSSGGSNLNRVLDVLQSSWEGSSTLDHEVPFPSSHAPHELLEFMVTSLDQAASYRSQALAALTESDRRFLFRHSAVLANDFTPQVSRFTTEKVASIEATAQFATLFKERVDYRALVASAQTLVRLADERWLSRLLDAFPTPLPSSAIPSGLTGDVRLIHHTTHGLIVIGGPGPNTYDMDQPVALIIDLGGDDLYRGLIGASSDEDHGNAAVIDLSGNDTYEAAPLGLATGRLGVGLVVDHCRQRCVPAPDWRRRRRLRRYRYSARHTGKRHLYGSALDPGSCIAGLGLLLDLEGHDRYDAQGFAIGFGGPLGVGAAIDAGGDDRYQCVNGLPSAYNASEAPQAKPGDPSFQYDCFGLGTGAGFRVFSKQRAHQAMSLAGGWGLLLDLGGRDHYQSANFSQGMGYFWGIGTFLDLDGDDEYQAARYGQGASAHYGVGMQLDYQGNDQYRSIGPYYNKGVSWDHGVSLAIDGGTGNDLYALDATNGLGKANHMGWAIMVDEGGQDRYTTQSRFGEAAEESLAGFFDLAGSDTYSILAATPVQLSNGSTIPRSPGGLFVDR
ncbi:MAG: hypothetical protein FJ247_07280 [Nitrospira sp.]|nr:hypothetical protein [Nitrospira sp.]